MSNIRDIEVMGSKVSGCFDNGSLSPKSNNLKPSAKGKKIGCGGFSICRD